MFFFYLLLEQKIMEMNDRDGFSIQTAFLHVANAQFSDGTKY